MHKRQDPDTIEKALIESAAGKIGSPINMLAYGMGCFLYDPATGKYAFQAMSIMRIGALITVIALIVGLVPYWFLRRGNQDAKQDTTLNFENSSSPQQPEKPATGAV